MVMIAVIIIYMAQAGGRPGLLEVWRLVLVLLLLVLERMERERVVLVDDLLLFIFMVFLSNLNRRVLHRHRTSRRHSVQLELPSNAAGRVGKIGLTVLRPRQIRQLVQIVLLAPNLHSGRLTTIHFPRWNRSGRHRPDRLHVRISRQRRRRVVVRLAAHVIVVGFRRGPPVDRFHFRVGSVVKVDRHLDVLLHFVIPTANHTDVPGIPTPGHAGHITDLELLLINRNQRSSTHFFPPNTDPIFFLFAGGLFDGL
uniref:(northern house mosquito) hypothetical protein n=1 Tax=Culex pipiens TaxID=7175 RepID=A0A8D8D237_CULPI